MIRRRKSFFSEAISSLHVEEAKSELISGQVYQQIAKGKMEITYLGEEPLKGIGSPVEVYKVI